MATSAWIFPEINVIGMTAMGLQLDFGMRDRFWHGCDSLLLPSMLSPVANVAQMLMAFLP
jgi:hypothetical protein